MDESRNVRLQIPFITMVKVALFLLLVMALMALWPVIIMLVIATMLAAMLEPVVQWLERHRVRRGFAVTAVSLALLGVIVLFFGLVIPSMTSELGDLIKNAPKLKAEILQRAPYLRQMLATPEGTQWRTWLGRGLVAGKFALEGITALLFVLVITIYLLIEGKQAFEWLLALAPKRHRERLRQTARESGVVAVSFMRGQIISSFICAIWVLVWMIALHVPAAVPLAVIAFVADFVPVAGTVVMTVPSVLLALTVSPNTALITLGSYVLYHLIENYFIIPKVYGKAMRLSTLTVLVAVTVGGVLQGIIGAVLILPFVAVYPIVERIWLREMLPSDTVTRHDAIEEA